MNSEEIEIEILYLEAKIKELNDAIFDSEGEYKEMVSEFNRLHNEHGELLVDLFLGDATAKQVSSVFKDREKHGKWLDDYDKTKVYLRIRVDEINSKIAEHNSSLTVVKYQENYRRVKSMLSCDKKPSEICDILGLSRAEVIGFIDTIRSIHEK